MNGVRRLLVLMGPALILCRAAFAEDVYTYWDPGSGIEASVTASKLKVAAGETVRFTSVASDIDHWVTFKPGVQSDAARDEGNVAGEGAEPDVVTYSWSSTGGRWLSTATNGPSVSWKAPNESGTYVITLSVDDAAPNVENGSRDDVETAKPIQIQVNAAKVHHLEAMDAKDSSRTSITLLQMASRGEGRSARVTAYKDNAELEWADNEPKWAGLTSGHTGEEAVIVTTGISGWEMARAGEKSAKVDIQIENGNKLTQQLPTLDHTKFLNLVNHLTSLIGKQGQDTITGGQFDASRTRWKVDRFGSPLCGTNAQLYVNGGFGLAWDFKKSIELPEELAKYARAEANLLGSLNWSIQNIHLLRDERYYPPSYDSYGSAVSNGSLVGTVEFRAIMAGFRAIGTMRLMTDASGKCTMIKSALMGRYVVGRLEGECEVTVKDRNDQILWTGIVHSVVWDGISTEVNPIELSGYL